MKNGQIKIVFLLVSIISLFISCDNSLTNDSQQEPVYYTVAFDSDGGTPVQSQKIEKGRTATKPTNPIKEGYTFSDWYNESSIFDFSMLINSDITLTAKWTKNTAGEGDGNGFGTGELENTEDKKNYTITFNINDASENPITKTQIFLEGKKTSLSTVLSLSFRREGYIFTAWNSAKDGNGTSYSDGEEIMLTESLTLYAQWTAEPIYYTVTFDSNGGTPVSSQKIEKGKIVIKPTNPIKEGYTFSAWYNETSIFDFSTPINSDIILKASWAKNSTEDNTENEKIYTITFNMNDGSEVPITKTQNILKGKKTSLSTSLSLSFKRVGYVFTAWNTAKDGSGTSYSDGEEITLTQNLTLYAQWTESNGTPYTVKHYQQNIENDNYSLVTADTQILTGKTNSMTRAFSKNYSGFTAQSFAQKTISPDGSTVIEIYYNRKNVTLSFSANGGTWSDGTMTDKMITGKYGANFTVPDLPVLSGYSGHWNLEIDTVFKENRTYSVDWIEKTKVPYTVTYMLQSLDGNSYQGNNKDIFYDFPGELTDAQPIEIEGFVLSPSFSITQKTITTDGKTSVWIYYDRITVTLTFNSNGGTWSDGTTDDKTINGKYGATVDSNAIPIPLKDQYLFSAWNQPLESTFTKTKTLDRKSVV